MAGPFSAFVVTIYSTTLVARAGRAVIGEGAGAFQAFAWAVLWLPLGGSTAHCFQTLPLVAGPFSAFVVTLYSKPWWQGTGRAAIGEGAGAFQAFAWAVLWLPLGGSTAHRFQTLPRVAGPFSAFVVTIYSTTLRGKGRTRCNRRGNWGISSFRVGCAVAPSRWFYRPPLPDTATCGRSIQCVRSDYILYNSGGKGRTRCNRRGSWGISSSRVGCAVAPSRWFYRPSLPDTAACGRSIQCVRSDSVLYNPGGKGQDAL